MVQENEIKSAHSMFRLDSTLVTLCLASMLAFVVWKLVEFVSYYEISLKRRDLIEQTSFKPKAMHLAQANASVTWIATAPGRVKPQDGEVRIKPEARGLIRKVFVKVREYVDRGDIIALLDDGQAFARLSAARAEVQIRLDERSQELTENKELLNWRRALDSLAAAERRLHFARTNFDKLYIMHRTGTKILPSNLQQARKEIIAASTDISIKRKILAQIENKPERPSSTRLDSGLAIARSDLRLAEIAYDKTRIRATASGMLLQLGIKEGEIANPASPVPAAVIGNLAKLEVTAEVEERDINQIRKGQTVIVRSNAFSGQKYFGKVIRLAPRVNLPGLGLRGQSQARDVEILEIDIALQGTPPLLSGMRVDVFFKPVEKEKLSENAKS